MKIKPETAEEVQAVSTIQGIWDRISRFALCDPLTSEVLRMAGCYKLNREDTAILLAFQALQKTEALFDEKLKTAQGSTMPLIYKKEVIA